MDTEQYEEAVRDYEKVYQTEKTKGEKLKALFRECVHTVFFSVLNSLAYRKIDKRPKQYCLIYGHKNTLWPQTN